MEALTHCLVCDGPLAQATVVHRRACGDTLVRCPTCGLLLANPQWTPAELDGLYRDEYYEEQRNFDTDFRERDRLATAPLYRATVADLRRRYPALRRPDVRLLDYGSGVGFFLLACREVGWQVRGLDFSEVAVRYGRERLGLELEARPDETLAALPSASFDVVTAWQVLEHLRRPGDTLRELVRVLRPGGYLCAAVPHTGALGYRLRGGRWFNVVNPTHLCFFDRTTLTRLYARAGLVSIERPVLWGGRTTPSLPRDLLQYAGRAANLGSELRLYARAPG
jgi:SAM-dependent methyltransferase